MPEYQVDYSKQPENYASQEDGQVIQKTPEDTQTQKFDSFDVVNDRRQIG